MIAKRIRCVCGRVYEPAKHAVCPACGAPPSSGAEKVAREIPDEEIAKPTAASKNADDAATAFRIEPKWFAIGGVILLALILLIVLLARKSDDHHKRKDIPVSPSPTAMPTASVAPSVAPPMTPIPAPPQNVTPIPGGQNFDLAAAINTAADGSTVRIPAGSYPGGLVAARAVHLIAGSGPVVIQAEGREALSVRAKGVSAQGIQFSCNGIGDLAAISIAKDAELDLDACRVQSSTNVAVAISGGSLTALGSAVTAANGLALQILGGKIKLTQTSVADSKFAFSARGGASLEFQSCAFERNGANGEGFIFVLLDAQTALHGVDCHFANNLGAIALAENAAMTFEKSEFSGNAAGANASEVIGLVAIRKGAKARFINTAFENNRTGLAVSDRGTLEMKDCAMSQNGFQGRQFILQTVPVSVTGNGASAKIDASVIANSVQFGIMAVNGGALRLDHVDVSGSRSAGIYLGNPGGAPAQAEIRGGAISNNQTGLGIFAGSAVKLDESKVRENAEGIVMSGAGSTLEMNKGTLFANREHGLLAHSEAKAIVREVEFMSNGRGAQSGQAKRNSGRTSIELDNCSFVENRVFGAGAYAQSELILNHCTFQGASKTNIFKERSAIVQVNTEDRPDESAASSATVSPAPEASASPGASPETSPNQTESPSASATPKKRSSSRRGRRPSDAERILRNIFGPR